MAQQLVRLICCNRLPSCYTSSNVTNTSARHHGLTETFFDEAPEKAKQLDDLRQTGQFAGPLQGLPMNIKDTFHAIGSDTTIGYILDRET